MISQGEAWWADLASPIGSGPGFRRPVVVVQGDALNRGRIGTVVCVPLTSNLGWADAPGNVLLPARFTKLPKDSVANVSQVVASIGRCFPNEWVSARERTWSFCLPVSTSCLDAKPLMPVHRASLREARPLP